MTVADAMKVLAVLQTNYPNSYKGVTPEGVNTMISLWAELFADTDYNEVMNAVKAIMLSDASDFAPTIGKINGKIFELREQKAGGGLTAAEAWSKVKAALSRGIYYSEEEFNHLDAVSQRIVGSPEQLRAWATLEAKETDTVIASNFMRSYNSLKESEKKQAMLPQSFISPESAGQMLITNEGVFVKGIKG